MTVWETETSSGPGRLVEEGNDGPDIWWRRKWRCNNMKHNPVPYERPLNPGY